MKLYEYNQALRELLENGLVVDEETGEILFEGAEDLAALEMAREEKILAVAKVLAEQQADLKAYSDERKALAARMLKREAAMEKKTEWLKTYLRIHAQGEKVKDGTISLSWRNSKSVIVSVPAEQLAEEYRSVKVSITPNKKKLLEALESGAEVLGVSIEEKVSPVIK
jgi:aldehyde:ferredoxin oxidoreductase